MKKLTPLESIRRFCLQCEGGRAAQVADCLYPACPFYAYRMGEALPVGKHRPVKAIRTYCVEECQGGMPGQVEGCQGDKAVIGPCPVFPFRMGRNPNISAATREKRKQAASIRAVKGVYGFPKTTHQTPFDAPESTETPQPDLG